MFCDLVGSTKLSEQLDPEELREVVKRYQEVSANAISRFEGNIAQYLGDGLLVYFGYPLAHEDDAQRAVRSGLEIVKEIDQLNDRLEREKGVNLAVRIGIHTGLVVVGEMGGGQKRERLALGDTPNIAARIQGLADPNAVVIGAATYRLIEGFFECHSIGSQSLKGVSQPMEVFRVLRESGVQSRFEVAIITGLTPLVGREREVQKMLRCWKRAKKGHRQVVVIIGEPGIGKSRLLEAFKERIGNERHTWIFCRCSPYYQNSAFYPLIELIERLASLSPKESSQEKLDKLERAFQPHGLSPEETIPLVASLLSIPFSDRYAPLSMTPQKQKQKTLEIMLAWLLKVAEQQPLVFAMEDLQWMDPSTLEYLNVLMDQGASARITLILTFRPTFTLPGVTRSQLTEIVLDRLAREQVEAMVEDVTGGRALPSEVLDQLVTKTDGVPLFVEELTKMVVESGRLAEVDGSYTHAGQFPELAVPTTLQDSLMARLDRLGSVKEVAQLGATLGREFAYEVINAVSALDERTLQGELAKLVEAEVLLQGGVPPQARYMFKHALIQDAAYESLLKSTRQRYHQKIAQVLEERFPETAETHPELLAQHYTEANMKGEAIAYWHKAGQISTKRSANLEAISHLTKGLELAKTLPDAAQRKQEELRLQVSLGVPLTATKGFASPEVEKIYARARELCQELKETPQLFPILRGLWLFYLVRAKLESAHELGRQLLRLAQGMRDSALLLASHLVLGLTLFYLGRFTSAGEHFEEGMRIYDPKEHHSLAYSYGDDPGVVCLSYSAFGLWLLGYPEQALNRDREALALAQEISHPFSLAFALNFSARLHQCLRDEQVTQERADGTIKLSLDKGFTHWMATGKILRGWALAELGRGEEGIAQIREGLSAWQATGAEVAGLHCFAMLVEAYGKTGRSEEGLTVLAEAFAAVESNEDRLYEPELYRLKGTLLMTRSEKNQAECEACFRRALEIARLQNSKSLELRAGMSLSRLWEKQDRKQEAKTMLSEIYGQFSEGFDTADLKEAKRLLQDLERK
jgi:class 3 adenylate cyclase/predicted ATPase